MGLNKAEYSCEIYAEINTVNSLNSVTARLFLMVATCSVLQKYLPEKLSEFERNGKRPLPMRIRLMCHSDCVKADCMGMSVAALGDSDGPPFVIQDIVKGQCPCSISVTASAYVVFFFSCE